MPAIPHAQGYSLWLIPRDPEGILTQTIQRAARLAGGPIFPPHITLWGGLEIAPAKLSIWLKQREWVPFTLYFHDWGSEDYYFRALVLRLAPNSTFTEWRTWWSTQLQQPEPPIEPHLSLYYGHLSPEQRLQLWSILNFKLPFRTEVQALALWRTTGPVVDWLEISRIELG